MGLSKPIPNLGSTLLREGSTLFHLLSLLGDDVPSRRRLTRYRDHWSDLQIHKYIIYIYIYIYTYIIYIWSYPWGPSPSQPPSHQNMHT